MNKISERLEKVKKEIKAAEAGSRFKDNEVLLIAVSKTHSADEINDAIKAGVTDIGENKVQEILEKYDDVDSVKWHMIGHLQTNKVKYIINKVSMIHSVDSFRLAEEIQKRAKNANLNMDILIQIDPADEETKFGVDPSEAKGLMTDILESCPNITIRGLMSMVPFSDNPEDVRKYFRKAKELYDELSKISHKNAKFDYLSMGMSNDYKVAIEEGSNMVRIGTAIFGPRNY